MTRGLAAVAAITLGLTLTACGEKDDDPRGSAGAGVEHGARQVTLLDAGTGPKRKLRLEFAEGQTQTSTMVMDMAMAMRIGDTPMQRVPGSSIVMTMTATVTEVDGDVATIDTEFTDIQARGQGQVKAQIEAAMEPLIGLHATSRVNELGEYLDGGMPVPDDLDPTMQSLLEGINSSMETMASPLPVEPVGVGARWEVAQEMETGGIGLAGVTTVELVQLTADGWVLATEGEDSAVDQEMELPDMPAGASAHLDSMEVEGRGRAVFAADSLMAVRQRMTGTSTSHMTLIEDGEEMEMEQRMTMSMTLTTG